MLDTPSLIINVNKMQKNIDKMSEMAKKYNVQLRPHSKTHKLSDIAKRQQMKGAVGITVAKISEAEVMAKNGITDIFVAYPLVTDIKIERALRLSQQINLIVGVDSLAGAKKLSEIAERHHCEIQVRLEIDTGLKRTGVQYKDSIKLAHQIQGMNSLAFRGIYTYRGSFMNGRPTLDMERAGIEEGKLMVNLAGRMRKEGIVVRDISVGSTPTSPFAAQVNGITEVRPGTYVFNDRMQMALGSCTLEECAAVVRVTVVSRPREDLLIIDGGSKTFATDVTPNSDPLHLQGFGYIVEAPHAVIDRFSEEHGMVQIKPEDSFKVGDTLHVIPNHICSTVNLHSQVYFNHDRNKLEEKIVQARGKLS